MKRIIILIGKNIVVFLSLLSLLIYRVFVYTSNNRVIFIDVGQGDATFIHYNNKKILIDGGPDDTIVYKLSKYMAPWDREIDLVILTHPHGDHIEGISDVLRRYKIGKVLVNRVYYSRKDWAYLLTNYDVEHISSGSQVRLDSIVLEFLWPELEDFNEDGFYPNFDSNINNDSLVFTLSVDDIVIFFSGDVEIEVEKILVKNRIVGGVDILQAGHHCSNTSNSKRFLEVLEPDLIICSLGQDNKFDHPGEETLKRFHELGIKYVRTDREGDIVFGL